MSLPAGLLPAGAGALAPVPSDVREKLVAAHKADRLTFSGEYANLDDPQAFAAYLAPLRKVERVVYAKRPFGGPEAVLAYLSRYTHRVAISKSRLIALDRQGVSFKWKDYRAKGHERAKVITLAVDEFIRPSWSMCCRVESTASATTACSLAASGPRTSRARVLLNAPAPQTEPCDGAAHDADEPQTLSHPCPCCGACVAIIERGRSPLSSHAANRDRQLVKTVRGTVARRVDQQESCGRGYQWRTCGSH